VRARVTNNVDQKIAMMITTVAAKQISVAGLPCWWSSAPSPVPTGQLCGIMQGDQAQAFSAAPTNNFLANATEKRSLVDTAVKKDRSFWDSDGTARRGSTDLPTGRFALGFAFTLAVVKV